MTRRSRAPLLLWPLAAVCPALVACEHPPIVDTTWASRARGVVSEATPREDQFDVMVDYGPPEDRERDPLVYLSEEEHLGVVEGKLRAGVYRLERPVLLPQIESLELRGEGPHKTRLELATDSRGSILITGAQRIVLRDMTLVGYTGGGLRIKGCPEVVVENVHFAGMRMGLELESSTAQVGSSVFDGCQQGLISQSGQLRVENSAFFDCWVGIDGRGPIQVANCVFVENREAIKARLDHGSSVTGSVFAGEKQSLAWTGRPGTASGNLVHEMEIGKRVGGRTNRPILQPEEFPDALRAGYPPEFDVVATIVAFERARLRGQSDPPQALKDLAIDRALKEADACKLASLRGDLADAKPYAIRALAFLRAVGIELQDAPDSVKAIAALAD